MQACHTPVRRESAVRPSSQQQRQLNTQKPDRHSTYLQVCDKQNTAYITAAAPQMSRLVNKLTSKRNVAARLKTTSLSNATHDDILVRSHLCFVRILGDREGSLTSCPRGCVPCDCAAKLELSSIEPPHGRPIMDCCGQIIIVAQVC